MSKSIKKNAVLGFLKSFSSLIFPLISFPYASRVLMPKGIGLVNFANSIVDFFLLIAGLGIGTYAVREGSKFRDDKRQLSLFAKEIFTINILSGIIAYILLFTALFFVPRFHDIQKIMVICSTKIIFEVACQGWILNVKEDYEYITIRSMVLQAVAVIFLLVFVKSPEHIYRYAFMGIIFSVGSGTLNFFYNLKYINWFEKGPFSLRKHLKPILIFFGVAVSAKLYTLVDTSMLGFLVSETDVGYYTSANKLINMIISLASAVIATFLPRCSYYFQNNLINEYNHFVHKALKGAVFFSLPAACGMFFLSIQLISIFSGQEYLPALNAMLILTPQLVLIPVCMLLQNMILVPQHKERIILRSQYIACIVNFLFNGFLIKNFKAEGAAIATFISQFTLMVITIIPCYKYVFTRNNLLNIVQVCFGAAVMNFVLHLMIPVFKSPAVTLAATIPVGCLSYACFMLLIRNSVALTIIAAIKGKIVKYRK